MGRTVTHVFGQHLKAALQLRGVSARELGRRWRPDNPDSARTSIQRYLAGKVTPGKDIRDELAFHLSVPASMLPVPEFTEEHALVADLKAALTELKELQAAMRADREKVA